MAWHTRALLDEMEAGVVNSAVRKRLPITLAFLFLLSLSIFAWMSTYWFVLNREIQRVDELHLAVVETLALTIFDDVTGAVEMLQITATRSPTWPAEEVAYHSGFASICVAQAVSETPIQVLGDTCPQLPKGDGMSRPLETRLGVVELWGIDQIGPSNAPVLVMSFQHGGLLWTAGFSTAFLQAFQNHVRFGASAHVAIFDERGAILAHPNQEWISQRRNIARLSPVSQALNGQTGVAQFFSPAFGTDMVAGFTHIPQLGWGVMVPQSVTELQGAARVTAFQAVVPVALALFVVMSAFLLVWFEGQRRLREISDTLDELCMTRHGVSQDVTTARGLGGLSAKFDQLSVDIKKARRMEDHYRGQMEETLAIAKADAARERQRRYGVENEARRARIDAVGRLVGSVAHEFNNVLSIVMAHTEMLMSRHTTYVQDRAKALEEIRAATERGKDLTKHLLSASSRARLVPQVVTPPTLIEREFKTMCETVPAGVLLEFSCPDPVDPVFLDEKQLLQVLGHLVCNAADASRGGGTVTLIVRNYRVPTETEDPLRFGTLKNCVRFTVRDEGKGMNDDELARACDPFYSTKSGTFGAGLGLPIAEGFATQSGGCLRIKSALGEGTSVHLIFPAYQGSNVEHTRDFKAARPKPSTSAHILLVEDEPAFRTILGSLLTRRGFEVTMAADGDEAARILKGGLNPSAIVTDMVMPGVLQGDDLVALIRRDLGGIPTVIMSGYADSIHRDNRPLDRFLVFLQKPVSARDIVSALESLGHPAVPASPSVSRPDEIPAQ